MDKTCELGPRLAPEPSGNVRPRRGVSVSAVTAQGPGSGKGSEEGGKRQRRRRRQKTGSRIYVRTPLTACSDRDVKASPGAGLGPAEPVWEAGAGGAHAAREERRPWYLARGAGTGTSVTRHGANRAHLWALTRPIFHF